MTTSPLSMVEGESVIIAADLTISDIDNRTLVAARVAVSGAFEPLEDVLACQVEVEGVTCSYSPSTGVLDITGDANLTTYQARSLPARSPRGRVFVAVQPEQTPRVRVSEWMVCVRARLPSLPSFLRAVQQERSDVVVVEQQPCGKCILRQRRQRVRREESREAPHDAKPYQTVISPSE